MAIHIDTPTVDGLGEVLDVLGDWQTDDAPLQLHPGDLGWFRRHGAEAAAAAIRTWRRDGTVVAVGLLDGADMLRLTTVDPHDTELAHRIVEDIDHLLPAGAVNVETPTGALVHDLLVGNGWSDDERWTPLRRDLADEVLADEVDDAGVRIEVVGPDRAADWAAVVQSSFGSSGPVEQRWHAMAVGPAYATAESLVAYDGGAAVAAITVWSAGAGRPGLIEPMGVHADHRGRGHGRAVCLAGASALQRLGSSSAMVCTPSARVGAVATYRSAGFVPQSERRDARRVT